jgi:DNA-directed RNA polymerase subunit beta
MANYKVKKVSNLVQRIDFNQIDVFDFEEPNLLETQKKTYNDFIENELETTIGSYFPITAPKNNRYEVHFNGIDKKNCKVIFTEEQARKLGETYAKSLFVKLTLVDNETGEVKKLKKSLKNVAKDGSIFFGGIPMMTEKGTFIINGTEKIVISQLIRSPGAYTLIKSNIKKPYIIGFILELLAYKGTLINFVLDKDSSINCYMKNPTGVTSKFPATFFLKALGLSQANILELFNEDPVIVRTLSKEDALTSKAGNFSFNEASIVSKLIKKSSKEKTEGGSPLEKKTNQYISEYLAADEVSSKNSKAKQKIYSALFTELAAKDIINKLGISTKNEEFESSETSTCCYQDLLISKFMNRKKYDLSSAGRYKLDHKFRIVERMVGNTITNDILANDKVLFKAGTTLDRNDCLEIARKCLDKSFDFKDQIKYYNKSK